MSGTPINEYIHGLIASDRGCARTASHHSARGGIAGLSHYYYEAAIPVDTPYKMFSALWRDNPLNQIAPGQRLMTMAALLHVDPQGRALLPELVRASPAGGRLAAPLRRRLPDAAGALLLRP